MPFKNLEQRREYRREWYAKNKDSEKIHVKRRKSQIKKWFKNYKTNLTCSNCPEKHISTLEFHHKTNAKKEGHVGNMVNDGFSIKRILEEIDKCIVLCANCHRKIHHK